MNLLTCLIPDRQFPIALLDRLLRRSKQSTHIYLEGAICIPQLWQFCHFSLSLVNVINRLKDTWIKFISLPRGVVICYCPLRMLAPYL